MVDVGLVVPLEAAGFAFFGPEVESGVGESWARLRAFLTAPLGGMMLRSGRV